MVKTFFLLFKPFSSTKLHYFVYSQLYLCKVNSFITFFIIYRDFRLVVIFNEIRDMVLNVVFLFTCGNKYVLMNIWGK